MLFKHSALFFSLISLFLLTPGCIIDVDDDGGFWDCERGQGPVVREVINLPQFEGIDLQVDAEVVLSQGPDQLVEVEAEANIIDLLERGVRNGIWEIDFDDCARDYDLTIYITLPDIRYVEISGSGDVTGGNLWLIDDLDLQIDGSGDMDLGFEADDVDLDIDGSGDVRLEGLADEMDINIEGSGHVRAFALSCNRANILIDGSGDVELTVLDILNVRIEGSGHVYYKGDPVVDVIIDGSGEVIDAN